MKLKPWNRIVVKAAPNEEKTKEASCSQIQ